MIGDRYDPMLAKVIAHGANADASARAAATPRSPRRRCWACGPTCASCAGCSSSPRCATARCEPTRSHARPARPDRSEPSRTGRRAALALTRLGRPWAGGWRLERPRPLRLRHGDEERARRDRCPAEPSPPSATDGGRTSTSTGSRSSSSSRPRRPSRAAVRHASARRRGRIGPDGADAGTGDRRAGRRRARRSAHQPLVIIEAMKMEHAVVAPLGGHGQRCAVPRAAGAARRRARRGRRPTMRPMADRDVRIYEVGPRDGLQNEATPIPTEAKLRFIELLADAGLREIEATSFVSPAAIPQLADADELMARPRTTSGVRYPVLVPNERGLARAEAAGVDAVCVFTAASEPFTRANINMTIAESIDAFRPIVETARGRGWWTRGYVSTAFGCPYQGEVDEAAVVDVARSAPRARRGRARIGDTIGVAGAARRAASWSAPCSARGSPSTGWRCTSTTRAARRSPTSRPRSISGFVASMRRRRDRRLSVRAGRGRQPRDRGPRLPARSRRVEPMASTSTPA